MTDLSSIKVYQNPPVGTTPQAFREVVAGAYMSYHLRSKTGGGLPTVSDIARMCGRRESTVGKVLATSEFRHAMMEKGIKWTTVGTISPEQAYAIGILTNPSDRRPMEAKLKSAGINYQKYRSWLKQPEFSNAIRTIGEEMLGEHLPDIQTSLVKGAVEGNPQLIKLYLELTGQFDPNRQQVQDLQKMVSLLLEIIFRNVTDVNALQRINTEFDAALAGKSVPAALIVGGNVVEPFEAPLSEIRSFNVGDEDDDNDLHSTVSPNGNQVADAFDKSLPPGYFDFQPED